MNIDAIFVISVREATQRREKMLRWWNHPQIKLNFHIVERNKDPELGCFQSHADLIRDAKNNNLNRILILEDDSIPVTDLDNLVERTNEGLQWLEKNDPLWAYFMLGYFPIRSKKTSNKNIINLKCAYLSNAYLVNLKNIETPTWTGLGLDDVLFCTQYKEEKKLNIVEKFSSFNKVKTHVYGIKPMLVRQEILDSYIAEHHLTIQKPLHLFGQDNIAELSCHANILYIFLMLLTFLILTSILVPVMFHRRQIPTGSTVYFVVYILLVIGLILGLVI
jgi:hypothetical protein